MSKSITWSKDRPAVHITPTFRYVLADNPDLTVVGLHLVFPPGASSPPHRHGTANVIAQVVEGNTITAMNDGEPTTYKIGESWYERPGCFHRISDNASDTERAVVLASFVIKTEILEKEGMGVLVKVEPEYLEGALEQMSRCGTLVAL